MILDQGRLAVEGVWGGLDLEFRAFCHHSARQDMWGSLCEENIIEIQYNICQNIMKHNMLYGTPSGIRMLACPRGTCIRKA